jgi:molybdenum cofactor guanylyltransferase
MKDSEKTWGIVLAGGESRRMGQAKERLLLGQETLLQRTAGILIPLVQEIVVVAAPDRSDVDLPQRCRLVHDPFPFRGPLAGLVAGLSGVKRQAGDTAWVIVVPCDHPGMTTPMLKRLWEARSDDVDAVAIQKDDMCLPLPGIYHTRLLDKAIELAEVPSHGLKHLLEQSRTRLVSAEDLRKVDPDLLGLQSVDSPRQWEEFLRQHPRTRAT